MTLDQVIAYCMAKPGAYLDYPFAPFYPVIRVKAPSQAKGRIFAQPFVLRGEPKVTLNCTPVSAEYYRAKYPGSAVRGWHCPPVQAPHFNTVALAGAVSDGELIRMMDHAYETVVAKYPRYIQRELRGESPPMLY
ncbi:MAG TPA: MmcQ/YjbR family DNA-binding protein [Candidatus Limiplasma sp.]|nr:MmcQ/YjbR family DNA-binding protein [Candidatus Limiplasma sp.]HRX07605.1 MmcQ/YjbR family DNA-binding protein [Candidatus Limiplasma sp.]